LEPERGISPSLGITPLIFSEEMKKIIKIIGLKSCTAGRFPDYETIATACSPATFVAFYDNVYIPY
jgi:hypothetical protein